MPKQKVKKQPSQATAHNDELFWEGRVEREEESKEDGSELEYLLDVQNRIKKSLGNCELDN